MLQKILPLPHFTWELIDNNKQLCRRESYWQFILNDLYSGSVTLYLIAIPDFGATTNGHQFDRWWDWHEVFVPISQINVRKEVLPHRRWKDRAGAQGCCGTWLLCNDRNKHFSAQFYYCRVKMEVVHGDILAMAHIPAPESATIWRIMTHCHNNTLMGYLLCWQHSEEFLAARHIYLFSQDITISGSMSTERKLVCIETSSF